MSIFSIFIVKFLQGIVYYIITAPIIFFIVLFLLLATNIHV